MHWSAEAAGLEINVTPHSFRRNCTTELILGGANLYYVKLTIEDLKATHARCHPRENDKPA